MTLSSAGILLYHRRESGTQVFLVHPGGPYWAKKDHGAWSVPKGTVNPLDDELACAQREFKEETGFGAEGSGQDLGIFRQTSGKRLYVWAIEGDCNPAQLTSNFFEIAWPPRCGRMQQFPEMDRGGWFTRSQALEKVVVGQRPIIEHFYEKSDACPDGGA